MHVHHLALRTGNVARLAAFYRDIVGLSVAERPGPSNGSAWLAAGSTLLMIEPCSGAEPAIPAGAMDLVAFGIPAAERARVELRLARAGVAVEGRTPFTVYVRDPDGRRVGVSHYPEAAP